MTTNEPTTNEPRRARRDEYRGNPLIVIPMGADDREFSFGVGKARAILENLEDVITFAFEAENTNPGGIWGGGGPLTPAERGRIREAVHQASQRFAPLRQRLAREARA
jgi:hypothetical protein